MKTLRLTSKGFGEREKNLVLTEEHVIIDGRVVKNREGRLGGSDNLMWVWDERKFTK